MIPLEPKLLQTPLAEDGEGNLGVTKKTIKKARSSMREKSYHKQTTVVGRPHRKNAGLELGSRTKELGR